MKRLFTVVLALALVALFAFPGAFAAEAKKEAKSQSWTGEVVDLGCYMGHGAKGDGHKECGLKCVANGMPMGLLMGGNKVYVLTMSHENADPFNACKGWVSSQVKVTGTMATKGGVQTIEVAAAELAAAPAK